MTPIGWIVLALWEIIGIAVVIVLNGKSDQAYFSPAFAVAVPPAAGLVISIFGFFWPLVVLHYKFGRSATKNS